MVKYCLTIYILLVACIAAAAQTAMRFTHITSGNGLCNDYIKCIFQDHTGFIWLGTYDGLCRYDGVNFITYRRNFTDTASLPSNTIYDIKEDQYGILWISTGKGLCCYDPATKKIVRKEPEGCDRNFYSFGMQIAGGHLWLPTGKALYDYNITAKGVLRINHTYAYPDGEGYLRERLYRDTKGRLWLLAHGALFFVDRQAKALRKISFPGTTARICSIVFDSNGRLWTSDESRAKISCCALTPTGAAVMASYEAPGNTDVFHTITPVTGISGNTAEKILLATASTGIYIFDPCKGDFTHVNHNPDDIYSLGNDQVTAMLQDASGLLWITTAYGADIYDPARQQLQTVFLHDANTPGLITDALPDNHYPQNKTTWLGTEQNEVVRFTAADGGTQHFALSGNGIADRVQYIFQQANSDLWIGGYYGFYLLRKNSLKAEQISFRDGSGPYSISCIRQLPGNDLLITSFENGIWIYRPGAGIVKHFDTKDGLFSNRCTYISGGKNGIYYITHIAPGISVLDVNNGKAMQIDFQPFLEQELHYPASFTYCSYPDADGHTLWTGTGLGLVKYDLERHTGQLLEPTTRLNTDNEIWSIVPEGDAYLWLKTTFGVYKIQ